MNTQIADIQEKDFTSLYIASDNASKSAQSKYIRVMAINLMTMILASGIALYNYQTIASKFFLYLASGILLLVSLMLTVFLLAKKYEDVWYQSRALAESCKTLTWRFMMCSELFEIHLTAHDVKERFIKKIQELRVELTELNRVLNTKILNQDIVTPTMLSVRALPLVERREYYFKQRIENQKAWYANKAELNKEKNNFWFAIIIITQIFQLSEACCTEAKRSLQLRFSFPEVYDFTLPRFRDVSAAQEKR